MLPKKPVNTFRPYCWKCRKNQATSSPSLPYCSKRLLRPPFKPDPLLSNLHFTEDTLPTRRGDNRCVPVIRNADIILRHGTQTFGIRRDMCLSWKSLHYCMVIRTSVFEIVAGRKFGIPSSAREAYGPIPKLTFKYVTLT